MSIEDWDEMLDQVPARVLSPEEVEDLADAVVDTWAEGRAQASPRRRMARTALLAAALLLAVIGAWSMSGEAPEEAPPIAERVGDDPVVEPPPAPEAIDDRVLASLDADYAMTGDRADRTVTLIDGRVRCEVGRRAPGERFRVVVGSDVVKVVGTRFTVTAERGRMTAVAVEEGQVELRLGSDEVRVLRAGEEWAAPRPTEARAPTVAEDAPEAPPPSPPEVVEVTPEPESPPVGAALRRGLRLLDEGRPSEAAAAFAVEAERAPLREDAVFWGAVALGRAGEAAASADELGRFLERYPASTWAGEAHCMRGRLTMGEVARAHFTVAVADPSPEVARCGEAGLAGRP